MKWMNIGLSVLDLTAPDASKHDNVLIEVSVGTGLTAPLNYQTIQKFFKNIMQNSHEWNQLCN